MFSFSYDFSLVLVKYPTNYTEFFVLTYWGSTVSSFEFWSHTLNRVNLSRFHFRLWSRPLYMESVLLHHEISSEQSLSLANFRINMRFPWVASLFIDFQASHKSPHNLEIETKEQRSHSTVSSNSVCGKIVDEVLLRINFEKEENQIEREASSSVLKNLTYTIECVPTESEPLRSSVRSPSSIETEREAASTSSLLKYPTPIPRITLKEPTAAAGQLRAASFRSHSSASKSVSGNFTSLLLLSYPWYL